MQKVHTKQEFIKIEDLQNLGTQYIIFPYVTYKLKMENDKENTNSILI